MIVIENKYLLTISDSMIETYIKYCDIKKLFDNECV